MMLTADQIECLCWPRDKRVLSQLNVEEFQQWYLTQPMQMMVVLGQDKEFKRFVFWTYTSKVWLLRLYYKLKRVLYAQI